MRDASEQVAIQIQHHIQRERLAPDDFLGREEDLAAEFGVSRPTIREALRLLASGNLIRATKGPGGGIFVASTADRGLGQSLSDAIATMLETGAVSLDELMDAWLALEVALAGRAASERDEEMLERLRPALGDDMEVHRILAGAAGNRVVRALTDWIAEVLQPALAEALDPAILGPLVRKQHEALLTAIERGDARLAERAMRDHIVYLRGLLHG
ncbi:MAG: FadR family transcriptional regulator [Thermoleophilaceae bacterium]|nr:FadR family transcriptional regulator [Thermoleophilaceae bacterium]